MVSSFQGSKIRKTNFNWLLSDSTKTGVEGNPGMLQVVTIFCTH